MPRVAFMIMRMKGIGSARIEVSVIVSRLAATHVPTVIMPNQRRYRARKDEK